MKAQLMKTNSTSNQNPASWWRRPITWADLVRVLLGLWISMKLLSFGGDHVSDAYHISRVETLVKQAAALAQQKSEMSLDSKNKRVNTLVQQALDHNNKITQRLSSSESAIKALDLENLR